MVTGRTMTLERNVLGSDTVAGESADGSRESDKRRWRNESTFALLELA